jgi:hypothetical protein
VKEIKVSNVSVEYAESMIRIFHNEYNPAENGDSPEITLSDILGSQSLSAISFAIDPSLNLQSLEKPEFVSAFGSKWYKCHLIPQTNGIYKNDLDNVIYASWNFHQIFDGLNTIDGIAVAVNFESFAGEEQVMVKDGAYESRTKLLVKIIFRYSYLGDFFAASCKLGTERLSDTEYRSFLFARDGNRMKFFLEHKYNATLAIWEVENGDESG